MAELAKTQQAIDITQSPEFKAAVEKAASEAAAKAIAEIAKHGAPFGAGLNEDATALFSKMALAIAEISDQGSNRKRVAPEVLAQRAAAAERCQKLVNESREKAMAARAAGDAKTEKEFSPHYRVIAKIYFNERLIDPFRRLTDKSVVPNEIIWTGVPNEALRPLNDIAKKIYTEFRDSIGSVEKFAFSNKSVFVTAQGLTVLGDPPKRREGFTEQVPTFKDELEVAEDPRDPTAPFVHVLGTIAQPARQNFAGQPKT